jgi:hypothetical protein
MAEAKTMTRGEAARAAYRQVDRCWPPSAREWRAIIRRYGVAAAMDAHEAFTLLHDDVNGRFDYADGTLREARGF